MIIRSLKEHWPARKVEWYMAGGLLAWGIYVLLHPDLFTAPATAILFAGMTGIASRVTEYPALFWGGGAAIVGLCRGLALFVNGAYTRTPLIRVLAAFASMFIVTQILIGFWETGVSNPGLVVYSGFILADLSALQEAAVDVVHAERKRALKKESRRALSNNSGSNPSLA